MLFNCLALGLYAMRMCETNGNNNNVSAALGLPPVSLTNNAAGLLQNGAAAMQTALPSGVTATGDRLDASSDSAVSSMGSERVPSLSDGEWGDAGSDSAQEYHQSNYNSRLGDAARHPVAQKKHQMFGRRVLPDQSPVPTLPLPAAVVAGSGLLQAQSNLDLPVKYEYDPYSMHHSTIGNNLEGAAGGLPLLKHQMNQQHPQQQPHQQSDVPELKYSCSLDFARQNSVRGGIHDIVGHNHTYTLPHGSGATPRPQARDKKSQKKADDEHLTRDEKRARTLSIPMLVSDIINLPMDEFNERLSKYDLTESQLSLIRDIRRRGKNKVAAQNCRKRKLDQIHSLEDEVKSVRMRKERLLHERQSAVADQERIKKKFYDLYMHIFNHLRDEHGNLYSPQEYNLHLSTDGRVHLLPNPNMEAHQRPHGTQSQPPADQQQQQSNSTSHHMNHHHHNPPQHRR